MGHIFSAAVGDGQVTSGTICTRNMNLGDHKVTKDAMGEALISVSKATKGKSKGQQEEKWKKKLQKTIISSSIIRKNRLIIFEKTNKNWAIIRSN